MMLLLCDVALRSIQGMYFILFVHYKYTAVNYKYITFQIYPVTVKKI